MKKILLIDGNSLFFRSFYANQFANLSVNGIPINGVYTFANLLLSFLLKDNDFFDVKIAFDKGKQTFRHQMYADYKAGRRTTPSELIKQLPIVREFLDAIGLGYSELDDYEADDIVGTYAKIAERKGFEVLILSSDKDLYQLITHNIKIMSPKSGVKEYEIIDEATLQAKWGIEPYQLTDLKGLMGDSSDNIKGVVGIGEKGAVALLGKYKTIENIYEHLDEITGATHTKLAAGHNDALTSKHLATIVTDIPLDEEFKNYQLNNTGMLEFFQKYNMISLVKRFCSDAVTPEPVIAFRQIKTFQEVSFADTNYLYVETLNDDYHKPQVIGLGFYNANNLAYFSYDNADSMNILNWQDSHLDDTLQAALLNEKYQFQTYDIKQTLYALEAMGYKVNKKSFIFDTKSALYVLNPEVKATPDKQIMILSDTEFIPSDEEIYGKGAKRTAAIAEDVKAMYIAKKTAILAKATPQIITRLQESEQYDLYQKIDLPLTFVLWEMEKNGVHIDENELAIQTNAILDKTTTIEGEIRTMLGNLVDSTFNLASPKQLKELLYDKMQLPDRHKGSTDREALEELVSDEYPVIGKILVLRKLQKLYSTYLKGFKKYIIRGKVHSKFNQNLTNTGRLSSSDPNLQNISIRDELQKNVRKIFTVSQPDHVFIGYDYSQIELRVLAQMANECHMLELFASGQDIHEQAAKRIFHLPDDAAVDPEMRRVAKVFNFGIIYGLSDFGLARDLKISVSKAKEYITAYFASFPDLKEFKDNLIKFAYDNKYARTLSKRIRNIYQLQDPNKQIRNFGERVAVNMPIQGTAADIIKVAMINIQSALEQLYPDAKIIAQIHDELIIEVPKSDVDAVKAIVCDRMQHALHDMFALLHIDEPVKVKLDVSFSSGKNWFELK